MRRPYVVVTTAALAMATITVPIASAAPAPADSGRDARAALVENLEPVDASATPGPERFQKFALGRGSEQRTYLIRLSDAAVPTYDGGISGLPATAPEAGAKLDASASSVRDYREHLVEEQVDFVTRLERAVGRDVEVPFTYQYAVNGLAAVLTPEEAAEVAQDPAVASITLDVERELQTDSGPEWSNADAVWNATEELGLPEDYRGEGVVIGTIDTGVNPGNRSFADVGGDGYDHTNPLGPGNFLGVCDPANTEQFDPLFPCNDKLIGAYGFLSPTDNNALDYDGHGSHTASTSGGNVVNGVVPGAPPGTNPPAFDISGVAPHANVITYLGCCSLSGLTASIDQAIVDGVDVINYSIGSPDPSNLWNDFDSVGFLNARAAGIFVATSNGNGGPGFATTGSPSDAPWITSVGASTHNRHALNTLTDLTSSAGPLADITGKSLTGPLPPTPIVYAGDFGDPLCQATTGNETNFTGKIVACDRGVNGRVEKSENVLAQGAVGYVLLNDEINGDSLLGDPYAVPGVFITFDDGVALKAWLASGTDHQAAVAGTNFTIDDALGDTMASFSSRGPNRAVDVIVPDVTAPGVDILAALGVAQPDNYTLDEHGHISGTSMSSPHVAGAGALLKQARPDWTPAQAQSALMTAARTTVINHDGQPATPYAQGAGHIDVGAAVLAGLLFDETHANYLAANPAEGGDPKALNLPSFANSQCLAECSWGRTATAPDSAPANVTWTPSVVSDPGLTVDVQLAPATVSPGDSMGITVTADVAGAPEGETLFARITLTPSDPAVPSVTMPVAVVPSAAVLPGEVDITTRRDAGSQLVTGIQSIEVTEFTSSVLGLAKADVNEDTLNQDPTRDDPYDDLSQVAVHTFEVPADTHRFISEIVQSEAPDLDMFVGTGDTPSLATEVCTSTSPSAAELCDIADPAPGTWWVLVQNWGGSEDQPDTHTLAVASVPNADLGNAGVEGPAGTVPVGEPYDVRVHWDAPEMEAGDHWYGTAILGSSPDTPDDIGSFPVAIRRVADDVTKTASTDAAAIGDTISYEITVAPNVTPSDLVYTITDTVPDGLTIDPASVTGGGVVDGQTITWEIDLPTPVGVVGDYVVSTPASSQQCTDWSGFLDLADFGIGFAGLDGDTVAATAFSNIGPFEQYGQAFPNLVVSEDGLVTVTGGYGGQPWVPQVLPNPAAPNGVFAPLWSDLELSLANERGMRLATAGDVAVIQWDDPFEFTLDDTVGPSVGKFQAWVYTTVEDFRPEVTFEYGELGALPATATIGIENLAGTLATSLLDAGDPSALLTEGGSICLDYIAPSFDPITVGYDVTVDDGAFSGTYTNAAVHTTDDPFAQEATASVDVEITGIEPCSDVIGGLHFGGLNVTDGVLCLDGALVLGKVSVASGAGLRSDDSLIGGAVSATGASEITLCDTAVVGRVTLAGGSAVTLGDAAGCGSNAIVGPVTVTNTDGPSVIAGNLIIGRLACSGNVPPPVNNGSPNNVIGPKTGQCAGL